MKERIEEILRHFNISSAQFADIIDVQRSSISHIMSGRNKPSFDFIHKILLKYPLINADWLITGRGNLLSTDIHTKEPINSNKNQDLFTQTPSNKHITNKNIEESTLITDVITNNTGTPNQLINNEVTNVNSVKSIIYVYSDDSFKILTSR